jgi:hypothetical protein
MCAVSVSSRPLRGTVSSLSALIYMVLRGPVRCLHAASSAFHPHHRYKRTDTREALIEALEVSPRDPRKAIVCMAL